MPEASLIMPGVTTGSGTDTSFVWPIVGHVFEHEWISVDCVFLHNSHIFLIVFRVVFIWNTGKVSFSVSEAGHQIWESAAFSGQIVYNELKDEWIPVPEFY